jgi:hypothetical protein
MDNFTFFKKVPFLILEEEWVPVVVIFIELCDFEVTTMKCRPVKRLINLPPSAWNLTDICPIYIELVVRCPGRISAGTPSAMTEALRGFPWSLQANCRIAPWLRYHPPFQNLSSSSFIIHPAIHCYIIWILRASWNNQQTNYIALNQLINIVCKPNIRLWFHRKELICPILMLFLM